jgi:hypothetical protein
MLGYSIANLCDCVCMDSISYIIESSVGRELQGGKLPYTSTKESEIIYDKTLLGGNCKELNSPQACKHLSEVINCDWNSDKD